METTIKKGAMKKRVGIFYFAQGVKGNRKKKNIKGRGERSMGSDRGWLKWCRCGLVIQCHALIVAACDADAILGRRGLRHVFG